MDQGQNLDEVEVEDNDDDIVALTEEKLKCRLCAAELSAATRVNFGCLHCYCKSCVEGQFNVAIKYSNLHMLKCPQPRCPAKALPNLIEGIVSKDLYEKYEGLISGSGSGTSSSSGSSGTSKRKERPWNPRNPISKSCPRCQSQELLIGRNQSSTGCGSTHSSCIACGYNFHTNCELEYHGICRGHGTKPNQLPLGQIEEKIPFPEGVGVGDRDGKNDVEMDTIQPENPIANGNYDDDTEFECPICSGTFTTGTDFGCGHKHCKACIKVYLETKIQDGSIYKIQCPAIDDCDFEAEPATIQQNVSTEMYTKYDEALFSDLLARDTPEIVNCPNASCQQRVVADPEYAYCNKCDLRFCTECNQPYHGLERCGLTEEERKEEMRRYIEATENERRELERQEDEKRKKHIEESDNLIKNLCKKCPNCVANIQKIDGCNRMYCVKCSTSFCWVCLEILKTKDPYSHFNVAGARCALR